MYTKGLSRKNKKLLNKQIANKDPESIVKLLGFEYVEEEDLYVSRMDPVQRKLGYCYLYDVIAPYAISAVIDSEPFFFNYDGDDWMVELWKGQYGMATGCELGFYIREPHLDSELEVFDRLLPWRPGSQNRLKNKMYLCLDNEQMDLIESVSISLYRNDELLFTRGPEQHWWLTGFKCGVYSEPEDLRTENSITFANEEIKECFLEAFQNRYAGTRPINVNGRTVTFSFIFPSSYQPRKFPGLINGVNTVRKHNKDLVKTFEDAGMDNSSPTEFIENMDKFLFLFDNFFGILKLEKFVNKVNGLHRRKSPTKLFSAFLGVLFGSIKTSKLSPNKFIQLVKVLFINK